MLFLRVLQRLAVQLAQVRQFLADLDFQPARNGLVPPRLSHTIGQIGFARSVGMRFVVRVAVGTPVPQLFHQFGGGVAQMDRHFAAFVLPDKGTRLFDKIGIDADNFFMGVMPDGTEVGGGGFFATTEDNLRLMLLYHNGGVWAGERILSSEYVRLATSKQIDTASEAIGNPPALDNFVGYGFQIWMCRHPGCYRADGAFGQYSIVHPGLDMIVSINETAGNAHWAQKTLDCVWRFFEQLESEPFAADDAADARLAARMQRLSLAKPAYQPHGAREQFTGSFATNGGKLVFGEATGSMMGGAPLPPDIAGCAIRFENVLCELKLRFSDQREQTYQIVLDGTRRENVYDFAGSPMTRVLLSGYFETPEKLVFSARFVETCYEQEYCLALSGNTITFSRRGTNASFAFLTNLVPSECVMERLK